MIQGTPDLSAVAVQCNLIVPSCEAGVQCHLMVPTVEDSEQNPDSEGECYGL